MLLTSLILMITQIQVFLKACNSRVSNVDPIYKDQQKQHGDDWNDDQIQPQKHLLVGSELFCWLRDLTTDIFDQLVADLCVCDLAMLQFFLGGSGKFCHVSDSGGKPIVQ